MAEYVVMTGPNREEFGILPEDFAVVLASVEGETYEEQGYVLSAKYDDGSEYIPE